MNYLERVVGGKVDSEEKDPTLVRTVRRSGDGCLPVVQVVADWSCRALRRWIALEVVQLLADSFERHVSAKRLCKKATLGGSKNDALVVDT